MTNCPKTREFLNMWPRKIVSAFDFNSVDKEQQEATAELDTQDKRISDLEAENKALKALTWTGERNSDESETIYYDKGESDMEGAK